MSSIRSTACSTAIALAVMLGVTACETLPEQPSALDATATTQELVQRGKTAIAEADAETALESYTQALEQSPGHPDLLNGKAIALDMLGRHAEAQPLYRQALNSQPTENDYLRSNLALSYLMSGEYDTAISELESIENIRDAAPVLRQNLALAYGLKGNTKKARLWGGKDIDRQKLEQNIAFYRAYTEALKAKAAETPAGETPAGETAEDSEAASE